MKSISHLKLAKGFLAAMLSFQIGILSAEAAGVNSGTSKANFSKYEHPEFGTNSRLDSMQAAATYVRYLKPLESKGLVLPDIRTASEHVFHLFIVQVEDRKRVMEHLGKHEVQTGIHYPIPFHIQGGYKDLGYGVGDFPVTEAVAKKIVSLPMFPEITEAQIAFACEKLSEALA